MIKFIKPLLFLIVVLSQIDVVMSQELKRYEFESQQMGTTFQIILYAVDDSIAYSASKQAFATIDSLNSILSDYIPASELNRFSQSSGSGQAIQVSAPLFELLQKSADISEETNGWFDVTIGPFTHIWRGLNRMSDPALPSESELANAASRVGHKYIRLDEASRSVELQARNIRLDPGGIGKGFASDKALETLKESGITRALVDAGGDISAGDPPPGKEGWSVAIPIRFDVDSTQYEELIIANCAVNTSGSLYQSVEIDGVTYSHIINPKTGLGHTEQLQVSVIARDGAEADALATALSVMPETDAQNFVTNRSGIEAVMFRKRENGTTVRWSSGGFDELLR